MEAGLRLPGPAISNTMLGSWSNADLASLTNTGATWTLTSVTGTPLIVSADGTKLITQNGTNIYISADGRRDVG